MRGGRIARAANHPERFGITALVGRKQVLHGCLAEVGNDRLSPGLRTIVNFIKRPFLDNKECEE